MFDAKKEPTYWFVLLEKAVEKNDFVAAAEAKRQLRLLGVEVTYRRHPRKSGRQGGRRRG